MIYLIAVALICASLNQAYLKFGFLFNKSLIQRWSIQDNWVNWRNWTLCHSLPKKEFDLDCR